MKKIENKCKTKDSLSLEKLSTFANDIKNRTSYDIDRLKKSITDNGFLFPLFIWKDKNIILDGKSRYVALNQLKNEGYEIPEIPIVYVDAKDEFEAREKVLQVNSRYGKITEGSLGYFSKDCEINLSDLNIHLDKINFDGDYKNIVADRGKKIVFGSEENNVTTSVPLDIGSSYEQEVAETPQGKSVDNNYDAFADIQDFGSFADEDNSNDIANDDTNTNENFVNNIENNIQGEESNMNESAKVSLTCPFCYGNFELTVDEIREILKEE